MVSGEDLSMRPCIRYGQDAGAFNEVKTAAALFISLLVFLIVSVRVQAQVPVDKLAQPPANAQLFTILSTAGTHGNAAIWTAADGSLMSRESFNLRGQVFDMDQSARLGADGMLSSFTVRGITPTGDAAETFAIQNGVAHWKSPVDRGSDPYNNPAFYVAEGGTDSGCMQLLLEALLSHPARSMKLLPGGTAKADRLAETTVGQGSQRKMVIAWAITGLSPSPVAVWATADNRFFGLVGSLSVLPAGYEGELKTLIKVQDDALAARSPALLKALLKAPTGPVAFTHVRAFVDGDHFAEDQTVVVDKSLIVSVGAAASTAVPASARSEEHTSELQS